MLNSDLPFSSLLSLFSCSIINLWSGGSLWWRHFLCDMLRLVMPAQVDLPLEAAAARLAGKGFESRVFPAVGDEVWWLAESFSTVATFVWLFTWNYILELYSLTVNPFTRKHMDSTYKWYLSLYILICHSLIKYMLWFSLC